MLLLVISINSSICLGNCESLKEKLHKAVCQTVINKLNGYELLKFGGTVKVIQFLDLSLDFIWNSLHKKLTLENGGTHKTTMFPVLM